MKKNILTRAARHTATAATLALVALAMSHTACTEEIEAPGRTPGGTPLHIVASVATSGSAAELARMASTRSAAEPARAASTAATTTGDQLHISYDDAGDGAYAHTALYTATVSSTGADATVSWASTTPICWEDLGTKGDAAATTRFLLEAYGNGRFTHTDADGKDVKNTATPALDQRTLDAYLAADYIKVDGVKLSKVDAGAELDKKNQQLVAEMTHQHTDVVASLTVTPAKPGMSSSIKVTNVAIKSTGGNYIPYIATAASTSAAEPARAASTAASTTSEYCAILPAAAVPLPGTGAAILSVTYTKEGGAEQTVDIAYTLSASDAGNAPANPADQDAWAAYFAGKRLNLALTLTDNEMSATATLTPWTERTGEVEMVPSTPFEINSAATLRKFAAMINAATSSDAPVLKRGAIVTADFTLNTATDEGGTGWGGIGIASGSYGYLGTFDGQGHTITLVAPTGAPATQGLFGYLGPGGVVKNITLQGTNNDARACITSITSSKIFAGGIVAGNAGGTVQNCHVQYLNINGTTTSSAYAGGIVAGNAGAVIACSVTACSVTTNFVSLSIVGGIVGGNSGGTVQNCYAAGNIINGAGSGDTGLLVGINNATVQNCAYITGDNGTGGTNGTLNAFGNSIGTVTNTTGYTSAADLNSGAPAHLNTGLSALNTGMGIGYLWASGTATNGAPMWQGGYLPVTVTTKK